MPVTNVHPIQVNGPTGREPLSILYLGCGHLIIKFRDEIILIDPYFSIQAFAPFKKIKVEEIDYNNWKQALATHQFDLKQTKSVWLAHTHYDHMMDLPFMLENYHFADSLKIYGSKHGTRTFTNFPALINKYNILAEADIYKPNSQLIPDFTPVGKTIEVLPICADHAPHFKVLGIPIHLMKGSVNQNYFKEHYKQTSDSTNKLKWRGADTYSYLIDFKTGTNIDYRIFVQTSAGHFPLGIPPKALLNDRPVDLAVLCLASSNFVKPYPVDIIKHLDENSSTPPKYMFIHWEDFFERPSGDDYKLVRLTKFRKISRWLNNNEISLNPTDDVMPKPGTLVVLKPR